MFEATLLPRPAQNRLRWTVLSALLLQAGALTALIAGPLLYPATLPALTSARLLPLAIYPSIPVKPQTVPTRPLHTPTSPSALTSTTRNLVASPAHGGMLSHSPTAALDAEPTIVVGGGIGTTFAIGTGSGPALTPGAPLLVVKGPSSAPKEPVRISSGVSAGMLLAPIRPAYPSIAKAAHLQGTVLLTCTIDKAGRIRNLEILSGPAMLRSAALDAVSLARYKPYRLNGEATEVTTTIAINFRLDSANT